MPDKWENDYRKEVKRQYKEDQRAKAAAERAYYASLPRRNYDSPPSFPAAPLGSTDLTPVSLVGIGICIVVLLGLVGGLVGAVQYGVESWLGWTIGTSFLMRVSGAALLGDLAIAILMALWVNSSETPSERHEDTLIGTLFAGMLGGLLGALLGGLAGWFGWAETVVDPSRGFHLPTLLERFFGWHWSGFWERVAGSAASVMVVLGLGALIGTLAAAAFSTGTTRSGRFGRGLLILAPVAWGIYWLVARA